MEETEFCVTRCLPHDYEDVLAFGNLTYCCSEDMEKEKNWHRCRFFKVISSYKIKSVIPEDPEESLIEDALLRDQWKCGPDFTYGRVIGVTKWKRILIK